MSRECRSVFEMSLGRVFAQHAAAERNRVRPEMSCGEVQLVLLGVRSSVKHKLATVKP